MDGATEASGEGSGLMLGSGEGAKEGLGLGEGDGVSVGEGTSREFATKPVGLGLVICCEPMKAAPTTTETARTIMTGMSPFWFNNFMAENILQER